MYLNDIYVSELPMEKRKRTRKKDYSETNSTIICVTYYNYHLTVIIRPSLYESGSFSFKQLYVSNETVTNELVTINMCV